MGTFKRPGWSLAGAIVLAAAPAMLAAAQELSDKTVTILMDMAFKEMPQRFTERDGDVIVIDKSNPKSVLVPVEAAKEVIVVARRGARAQVCDMVEEHLLNFESLKARENAKKTWSIQQKKYMMMLHSVVIRVMTGNIKTTEKEAGKTVSEKPLKSVVEPCTPEEKVALKQQVLEYVKAGPTVAGAPPAPPSAATAATQKK